MEIHKQNPEKWKNLFFILAGFFTLFLILSFFSISTVYAIESEMITIDNESITIFLANDSNQKNLSLDEDLDFHNGSWVTTSNEAENSKSDGILVMDESIILCADESSADYEYEDDNCKNSYDSYSDRDSLEKIGGKSTQSERVDFNNVYFISLYLDPGFNGYYNDILDYFNHNIVLSISSSNFKGNGFGSFNNFIKKVANIYFNKVDNHEDTLIIQDFQSSFHRTLTILFFIKIFMDFHNNGKEHLNSF